MASRSNCANSLLKMVASNFSTASSTSLSKKECLLSKGVEESSTVTWEESSTVPVEVFSSVEVCSTALLGPLTVEEFSTVEETSTVLQSTGTTNSIPGPFFTT